MITKYCDSETKAQAYKAIPPKIGKVAAKQTKTVKTTCTFALSKNFNFLQSHVTRHLAPRNVPPNLNPPTLFPRGWLSQSTSELGRDRGIDRFLGQAVSFLDLSHSFSPFPSFLCFFSTANLAASTLPLLLTEFFKTTIASSFPPDVSHPWIHSYRLLHRRSCLKRGSLFRTRASIPCDLQDLLHRPFLSTRPRCTRVNRALLRKSI